MLATTAPEETSQAVMQVTTFYVGNALLGVDIGVVQEINRNMMLTRVPDASPSVRGVMNLRGEVVTVLDLRILLGLPQTTGSNASRNLIIKRDGELIGIWVDRVADILSINMQDVSPAPSNLDGIQAKFVKGVYQLPDSLVMLLDHRELINASLQLD